MNAQPGHEPRRTRLAVFGSVAAERGRFAGPVVSPAVGAVLEQVYDAVARSAPAIAAPIIDEAVAEGRISRVERHALLRELGGPAAVDAAPGTSVVGLAARRVLREALAAVRREAPAIAAPILDEAVGSERLTRAQQQRVLERLRTSPARALRSRRPGSVC